MPDLRITDFRIASITEFPGLRSEDLIRPGFRTLVNQLAQVSCKRFLAELPVVAAVSLFYKGVAWRQSRPASDSTCQAEVRNNAAMAAPTISSLDLSWQQ